MKLLNQNTLLRVVNLFLRLVTLFSKFAIIVYVARVLSPAEVGLYGLFVVSVSYSLYFLGFDFYTFSSRDILGRDKAIWGRLFKSQLLFFGLTYLIVLPLSTLLFIYGFLPFDLIVWFLVLMVLEHMNQELSRLLIVLSEQLYASLAMFFRSGLWCLIAIVCMWFEPELRNLNTLFFLWAIGSVTGVVVGLWRCSRLKVSGWKEAVDWHWIRKGLVVAGPLLVSTLALRGLFTVDRYWFETLSSLEVLGAYTLFIGLGSALISFLEAGVFMFSYPKLIRLYKQQDKQGYSQEMKRMLILTLGFCLVFALGSALVLPLLLQWLGNEIYIQYQSLFWCLLLAMSLYAVGMIPHYGLYTKDFDKPLIYSHLLGFVFFLLSTYLISKVDRFWAVPVSLNLTFFVIFLIKLGAYWRHSVAHSQNKKITVK
ncbi:lipopolysaccharide biosynthesis protein [Oligella urethralis]|uniref:lipopolysaccharide biosynthesis protein n=1 Tax=Oligella urethralis TaxID=90245 RepID=UPI000371022D|nr:oligosaccharide flippase family protein [Oligella urethralis]SUA66453.1 Polysaccharide biosynthesis protein [Oligella urethralis]